MHRHINVGCRVQDARKMKVAAIVPAYNEALRIGAVLDVLCRSEELDEIIVVDDASEDNTEQVAASYSVKVIKHPVNTGKGGALKTGINATDAEILLFIDADLVGLKKGHIHQLVQPIRQDKSLSMTTSRFVKGRGSTNWSQRLAPILNSQRAIRRSFLETVPDFSQSRFAVETIITKHARKVKAKTKEASLPGVTHVLKEEKQGPIKGVKDRLKMYKEILKHL